MFGVEWPEHHPMWADRDGRTGVIERRVIAVLRRAAQHIAEAWGGIRGC